MYNTNSKIMKKVLFVLALVMVYGLSVSTASAKMVITNDAGVTVVVEDNQKAPEGDEKSEKVAANTKSAACGDKTSATASVTNAAKSAACGDSAVKAEATSSVKSAACGDKAATTSAVAEVTEQKSE